MKQTELLQEIRKMRFESRHVYWAFRGYLTKLETCENAKISLQKPYSGHIALRVPPELHAKVAMLAKAHGIVRPEGGEFIATLFL